MKLRIKGASLRLRLTQKEVRSLGEGAAIEERVPFPAGALTYRLARDARVPKIQASLSNHLLEVRIPEKLAQEWCTSETVTLAERAAVPEGTLEITLEKDFACLKPRADEDESDNFPHPESASGKSC